MSQDTLDSAGGLVVHEAAAPAGACGTLVLVHDHGGDAMAFEALRRDLAAPLRIVCPQAARPCVPILYGAFASRGYFWFYDQRPPRPEPATFGDSLWALEELLAQTARRHDGEPIFLVGFGQGAVLAATLAFAAPDLLTGVAIVGGYRPQIPGWAPPEADLSDVSLLVLDDPEQAGPPDRCDDLAAWFSASHGRAQVLTAPGAVRDPATAAPRLAAWLEATYLPRLTASGAGERV